MDAYEKEKKKLRSKLGEVGYTDLDLDKLSSELVELYHKVSESYIKTLPELKSIYIVGSFAEGKAIKTASDIDIRYVSKSPTKKEQRDWLNDYVTYNGKEFMSKHDLYFGYVDANLSHQEPPKPCVKIY